MLGAGVGLLLAGRLSDDQRRAVGRSLVAVGVLTTVPLVMEIFGRGNGDGALRSDGTRA